MIRKNLVMSAAGNDLLLKYTAYAALKNNIAGSIRGSVRKMRIYNVKDIQI